jgi:hypothetical protein
MTKDSRSGETPVVEDALQQLASTIDEPGVTTVIHDDGSEMPTDACRRVR